MFAAGASAQENQAQGGEATTLDLPGLTEFAPAENAPDIRIPSDALRNVDLDARLVEGGAPLEHGLIWRVYHPIPDGDGKLPILATSEGGSALISMEPGEYFVHVSFGLAGVTRKLVVPPSGPVDTQDFILNAGGLVLNAVSGNDVRIPPAKLKFSIYSEERDANGQRQLIIADVQPAEIVRLNDGIYHVVSEYGEVNAVIRSDISVAAGKLTEATIQHRAAQITLKLVADEGGEAIADTAWSITNSAGDLISESVGAFPSLVLAEGDYTAIARHKEQLFRRDFKVAAGFNYDVEVLLQ
ncbi:hypothetical protein [Hoeflea sp.]|uniref:hypothetical protein n=1 Tax=Hoeflea sp. TaxID=1940281 RepID=UPI003B022D06